MNNRIEFHPRRLSHSKSKEKYSPYRKQKSKSKYNEAVENREKMILQEPIMSVCFYSANSSRCWKTRPSPLSWSWEVSRFRILGSFIRLTSQIIFITLPNPLTKMQSSSSWFKRLINKTSPSSRTLNKSTNNSNSLKLPKRKNPASRKKSSRAMRILNKRSSNIFRPSLRSTRKIVSSKNFYRSNRQKSGLWRRIWSRPRVSACGSSRNFRLRRWQVWPNFRKAPFLKKKTHKRSLHWWVAFRAMKRTLSTQSFQSPKRAYKAISMPMKSSSPKKKDKSTNSSFKTKFLVNKSSFSTTLSRRWRLKFPG